MRKGILKKYRLSNDGIRISAFGYDVDIPKYVGLSFPEPYSYATPSETRLIINHLARRNDEETLNHARPLINACRAIQSHKKRPDFKTLAEMMNTSGQTQRQVQMA
ncbi:MAG: hypothetical protein ACQETE_16250 [Bacteroidota bacterium]